MSLKKEFSKYFSYEVPIQDRICYLMCICGLLASIMGLISTISIKLPLICVILSVAGLSIVIILSLIAFLMKKTKVIGILMTIIIGNIIFPFMFLTEGGINGGMSYYFFLASICIAFCIRNKLKFVVFGFSVLEYSLLLIFAYNFPEKIIAIPQTSIIADIVSGCIVTFIFLFLFADQFARQCELDRKKIQQLSDMYCHQANTDELTGLFNRRYFKNVLDTAFENVNSLTEPFDTYLAMFDIDDFKKINDNYGHAFGDVVLKKVADILSSESFYGTVSCRYGGEEFLMLIRNVAKESAYEKAERILMKIRSSLYCGPAKTPVTVSCGFIKCEKNIAYNDMLQSVDEKLYEAKNTGKNKIVSSI